METDRELLELAAKAAGVHLRMGNQDDDYHAVVMWRSSGPLMHGCTYNRVLICNSHEEAMISVEIAGDDLLKAKSEAGYFSD